MKLLFFVEQPYSFSILRPLQAEALARGDEVFWFLYNLDDTLLESEETLLKTVTEVNALAPDAVVCPGNWLPHFFPGLKVQIFHGFGIEKKGHFKIRGFFDLYCSHGPLTTQWYKGQARIHKHFSVVETGWSKLDTWLPHMETRTQISKPIEVLYAPTFSRTLTSVHDLFRVWEDLSKSGNHKIAVKFHPLMSMDVVEMYKSLEGKNLVVLKGTDVLPAIGATDIVVSDTSSIVAESLYLGKPVITYRTKQPGKHVLDISDASELLGALEQVEQNFSPERERGVEYANNMHPYKDGKSSARVLDAISDRLAGKHLPLRNLPLNILRKRKVRKQMRKYL